MTKLMGYLGMDMQAMTLNDWMGVFYLLVATVGMVSVYVMVFRPANKAKFESQRSLALDDDDPINMGDKR